MNVRIHRAYFILFISLIVKAVHFEIVANLLTGSFLVVLD